LLVLSSFCDAVASVTITCVLVVVVVTSSHSASTVRRRISLQLCDRFNPSAPTAFSTSSLVVLTGDRDLDLA